MSNDHEENVMTAKEAIEHVTYVHRIPSYYALAQSLSDKDLNVQPIQVSNYVKGKLMSEKVAQRFFEVYGVVISDAHRPGAFQRGG